MRKGTVCGCKGNQAKGADHRRTFSLPMGTETLVDDSDDDASDPVCDAAHFCPIDGDRPVYLHALLK